MVEFVLRPYLAQKTGKQFINDDYTLGITREDLAEVLNYIASLYTDNVVIPAAEANVFRHSPWTNPRWINGEMVYQLSWTSVYASLVNESGDERGTFILPARNDAKDTGLVVTPSQLYGISNKSKAENEAVRFLNFFLNDIEAGKILGTTRAIPPSAPVRNAIMSAGLIDQNIVTATDYAQKNRGITPNTLSTNAEITQTLEDAVEKVSYNPAEVNAAADQAFKLIENILTGLKP
jgi:oligogalacturonide transport system substrate-binding protein